MLRAMEGLLDVKFTDSVIGALFAQKAFVGGHIMKKFKIAMESE